MDLLQTVNTLLFASAGAAGLYAVGRLFYIAGTAPTNVSPRQPRTGPTIFPAMAMANEPQPVYTMVVHGNGLIMDVTGNATEQPKETVRSEDIQ
jgi:hypothetical protein